MALYVTLMPLVPALDVLTCLFLLSNIKAHKDMLW